MDSRDGKMFPAITIVGPTTYAALARACATQHPGAPEVLVHADAQIVMEHPGRNGVGFIGENGAPILRTAAERAAYTAEHLDRHSLAAITPITAARKPRSLRWLEAEVHNRGMKQVNHYSDPPYVEFWADGACIGRDPMPTICLLDDDRALFAMPVEVPGPNCLDAMARALGLTDDERVAFRCRREDAAVLLEEHAAQVRAQLEQTAPRPKEIA
jgi:2-hydroxychromene-2-carboxylate isomerase